MAASGVHFGPLIASSDIFAPPSSLELAIMPPRNKPYTEGSRSLFDPDAFFDNWDPSSLELIESNKDLRGAIIKIFNLPQNDSYVYHAPPAAVTLAQVQSAINAGRVNGLLAWYRDGEGKEVG
jgi:hypothetical protein